ncbi:MAG: ion transporter [Bacteroidaceae bacterium]|nr:ion transporter [Bacteroidaceae bacterium]
MSIASHWQRFKENEALKKKLYDIIFESDTFWGKTFDIVLIACITLSILITIFDSLVTIPWLQSTLVVLEYLFTVFFTLEYLTRLYCSPAPKAYAKSFFGIVDLLSILPMYLGIFFSNARFAIVLRSFRLIRVFRIFKLFNFLAEGNMLLRSLKQSANKILVYFLFVVILVVSLGTLMFMVESGQPDTQFTDIPTSIYWAIVTMTTVGYGDITPVTAIGRFLSALVMLLGYTILAVPTGIVSASMIKESRRHDHRSCPNCQRMGHEENARYCKHCGAELEEEV